MNKMKQYFEHVYVELTQKTTWPSWGELQSSAVVVMVASLLIALTVYFMDSAFSFVMTQVYGLFQ